ncbi:MAG: cell division ATP-binding protein FtsE [Rhodospirillales bacterium]|nr:MAG: cell division ATP-binding protein FtsE [Rhodospirillales bacterium]
MDRAETPRVVAFDGVGLGYPGGTEVLHDVTFSLDSGSFHFLTGPSGAGKTSLLRLMYLAVRPTRGTLTLFGQDITRTSRRRLPDLRRRIGVVFQDFRLIRHLSAFDNVALPLRIAGAPDADVRRNVCELLQWVGLEAQSGMAPATLSGGQQQLVAVARAVIARPRLLLADEPTGNVDERVARRLMYLFEELNRLGTTVLVATHDEGLVRRYRHPRLALKDGALAALPAVRTAETVTVPPRADGTPLRPQPVPG